MAVAAKVQRGLLPPLPARMRDLTWHAEMDPAGQIGDDYSSGSSGWRNSWRSAANSAR